MFTSPLRAPAGEGVPEDADVHDIDLRAVSLSGPATSEQPDTTQVSVPLSVPLLKLQMQDTTRTLFSHARQAAHTRCHALKSRAQTDDALGLHESVRSRLWVVQEVLAEVPDPVEGGRAVRDGLRHFRTAQTLMDAAERVLNGDYPRVSEAVRRACLEGAWQTRLSPQLDPDFMERIVRVDLLRPDELGAWALQDIDHPYRAVQPRFSCWKDAPVAPAPGGSAVDARDLSTEQISNLWERLVNHGVINAMSAARMLRVDRDSDPADVDAVVAEWLTLPAARLQAVFAAGTDVVVLRCGSAAARQVFGTRPEHQQACFDPGERRMFIGVKARGDQREVPAARVPQGGEGPSHFWLEHGRLIVRDVWNDPAETPMPTLQQIACEHSENPEFRLGWDTGVLDLPDGGFLQALAAATDDAPLGFPLGPSEEATQATVVARYLLGQSLPQVLRSYVISRMADEGLAPTTAV